MIKIDVWKGWYYYYRKIFQRRLVIDACQKMWDALWPRPEIRVVNGHKIATGCYQRHHLAEAIRKLKSFEQRHLDPEIAFLRLALSQAEDGLEICVSFYE